jgi:hypothetical protein
MLDYISVSLPLYVDLLFSIEDVPWWGCDTCSVQLESRSCPPQTSVLDGGLISTGKGVKEGIESAVEDIDLYMM